ncbi:uncharacterized protein LOC114870829 isoform X2 [Betta splendens]|uniref:Uncharacterized protein LOC114870829 isoform X2 n=1 Tax=Betta splendens TaxID=158456 RepID=A0A9W2XAU9_BETSP|nr:uncharacterized protein LOC114870829 isoform X2 [Betta splendens]
MTSVEKRRSSRKSGGHRKHSDGGYSDTSSGGSFLDETDREVSNLTDRAFRSLCIGDEAVYNDSDLCSSSPCFQRDRQLAFGQSGLARDREDREELKRAAHESFSLRVQHYGQDWLHGGMFGADIHRDPQWEVYGQNTQGRISATFQHSFMETSQQEKSLREEHLSFLNGATELSLQQRRSRSRVSSLIRAFNSEGQRDGSGTDTKLREWNDETCWDKSALMSIQRELSEFSYQQNFNNGHFPSAGPFASRDSNCYSSEVAAVTHQHSDASFMRSSHSAQSLSAQVNCNSNFFIHSEYSPFKLWRDHNRFPFRQGEVSGFMPRSEFPKWYETPMYKELSLETDTRGPYRFAERGVNHPRNNLANVIQPSPPRSTSTSTVLQKTLAVEKRCESELASHYPHRKRAQSLGNNRLPSQRPSTASPTTEMSQRVRDTIRSAEALRQKIQMITEQNMAEGFAANQQEVIVNNDRLVPFGNAFVAEPPNVSPQPIEHPPVRAESRGATPDARMSSYKSRATSLLFNLKDNRKRVKSTYSPTKFKGLDAQEKHKQFVQEPRDTVIDIPDFPDSDIQFPNIEEASRTNVAFHQHVNQYHSTALSHTTLNSQPATAYTGHSLDYTLNNYQAAQTQGEIVHHTGFADFISKNDTSYHLVNGQNLQDSFSFAPYNQAIIDHPAHKTSYMQKLNTGNNQIRDYSISESNTEQCFNEKVGREFTKVERYQQLKDNKHDYSNVSLQDRWRPTNSQDTEKLSLKADTSPWKQEITALPERDQCAQTSQRAAAIKEERNLSRDTYRRENQQSLNKELKKPELGESFGAAASHQTNASENSNKANQLPQYASFSNIVKEREATYGQQPRGASSDKNILKTHYRNTEDNEIKENDLTQSLNRHNPYSHGDTAMLMQETALKNQSKHPLEIPKVQEPKLQLQHHLQNNLWSQPDRVSVPTLTNQVKEQGIVEVKAAEYIKAQHAQAQLAKAQPLAQVESARLILAGHTSSEKARAEKANADLPNNKRIEPSTADQIKEQKVEDKGKVKERQLETARVRRVTDEPRIRTKEAGAVHLKEEEGEQVKAEQAKVEKTELVKRETEQAREQQTPLRDRIRAKQGDQEEVRTEQVEREHKEEEQIKTEKVKAAGEKAERAKEEQMEKQQTKAEQQKVNVVEKAKEKNKDLTDVGQANAEQPTAQTSKVKGAAVENRAREQVKLLEKWTTPAAKLTMTQHVKIEPDKVEQVKSELAKAKAELAKIKEKMKGEQKEKDRSINSTKEDNVKIRDVGLGVNSNKTNDYSVKDKTTQGNQQRENKIVRGADDYERLREKYGFTNAVSTNINTVSTVGNHLLHNAKETPALSLDKIETMNTEKPKPEHSPTARIENIGVTDSHYVYSESSKEFKLTSAVDSRANSDTVADKSRDHSQDKLENCESAKQTDPQQRDPDLNKNPTLERKPKSAEQCLAPPKDSCYTPPRALSHKEKVQTKQEILTSRIKAHAEKEISAIKEKGLAMRDGIIGKNSNKQVATGQSIRQRPAPHDVSKKQGSTASSNITPQHQMEPLGIQMAPAEAVSPLSPAPVTSASSTSQLVDHSQKQAPKEPEKAIGFVLEPHVEVEQTQICAMSLIETQKEEKQGANPEEHFGQKETLKDRPIINTSYRNKNKENPQKEENKQEASDSAPSLNVSFGQNEGSVADDNLQIMGIRVMVRERKTSLKETPADNSTQEQMEAEGSKCCDSDLNKSHPSLNSEVCKEKSSSLEMVTAKTKDLVIQEAHLTARKEPMIVAMNMKETMLRDNNEIINNTEGNDHKAFGESVPKQNFQLPVKEDTGPLLGQKVLDSPATKQVNTSPSISLNENTHVLPKLQYTGTNIEENNEVDDEVHIDSIAIRVLPAVTGKHNLKTVPAATDVANEHKQEKAINSNVEDKTEHLTPTNTEKVMQDSLEDKSGVQYVLSSVRKLSQSQKTSNQQDRMYTISVKNQIEEENPEKLKKSVDESKFKNIEGNYFQVQGLKDTYNRKDDIPDGALKTKNKDSTSSELHKGETDVLCQSNTVQSSSVSVKNRTIKRKNPEMDHQLNSKLNEDSTEEKSSKEILNVGQANHIRKHPMEGQTREKERSRRSYSPNVSCEECEIKERSVVKPKERTSTIPEISAIADYARLKVIVSEDHANTVQDFAPNRKEGFFPLIQTRHSRRPVSTTDSKDVFEKDNSFPNKIEVNAKVNKEPKVLVFPITEKEHQRTGMFKLGDKERQDKLPMVKSNEKHVIKSTTAQTEHVDEPGMQISSQRGQSIPQATRNTDDGLTYFDKSSASETTVDEEENKSATKRETMAIEIQEKREKNTQAGKMREEETKIKLTQEERAAQLRARQCDEGGRRKEDEEKSRMNIEETKTKLKGHQEQIKDNDKEEQHSRAAKEAQETKAVQKEQQQRTAQEQQRKAVKEEQQRRAAQEEQQQRAIQEEQQRRAAKEQQRRALQEEQQRIAVQEEQQRRAIKEEQQRKAAKEQQRRALQEEQQRRAVQEEQQRRAIQEEQQRKAAKEQQRKALQDEHQRRAVQEEQHERAAREEQQPTAIQEEQQRRAIKEEQQRKAANEQQRRALQEEQQRRIVQEEQQRKAAKEQQRRALQDEHQRRAVQEEQHERAAREEQQTTAIQEKHQRRAVQEEQERKAAKEEQQTAAKEEQKRRAVQEEQQRKAAQEERQRRAAQEEQQRKAAQEEQQRRAAQEEQQKRAAQEEQQRKAAQEEQQRKAAQEKHQRRAAQEEQQKRAAQEEQQRRAAQEEQQRKAVQEEQQRKAAQEEQQRRAAQEEQQRRALQEEQQRKAAQDDKVQVRQIEEKIFVDIEEQNKLKQREWEEKAEKENTVLQQRKDTGPEMEEEKRASQRIDALQYYAITSTEAEQKPREKQQRNNLSGFEVPEDPGSHSRLHRPQAPASPASSLPRSNTSSPALGAKPSMFRVKDNTSRGSSLTKSVKPRFHKSFGEDFRVGSPMERGEEEQEISRRSAMTPSSSKDYSAPLSHHRPYSRRSLALDEDDSRSVISNMSEGAESFASCATDMTNIRGLHDYERPESACSFSSDVSRSLGKPPTVPPKSEKALQRAKRLTSRRIKKELTKAANLTCGVDKPPEEVSSSTEASSPHAVASAHFSPPVSIAHAPTLGSSVPSSLSAHGSPHTTGPIALPAALPHATAPVSLTATPKTVAHVASSPTLHHANQPAPVTKYHVEPNYAQPYPLTQRKVLQDLGSGQYYVVDVPVQVKTKTFFDPETGNYVQLNVRESSQSSSRPRPQQTYPQPHVLPQVELNPQQPVSQASPAGL